MERHIISLSGGGYHGIAQVIGKMTNNKKQSAWKSLNVNTEGEFKRLVDIVLTFFIVSYGWMIFYVSDYRTAIEITKGYFHMGVPYVHQTTLFFLQLFSLSFSSRILRMSSCQTSIICWKASTCQ